MVVAALVDLGMDHNILSDAIVSMPVPGVEVLISRVKKQGLDVCDFRVVMDAGLYSEKPTHRHRGLKEVTDIIKQTRITDKAKNTALKAFEILGRAEAKVHGTTLDEIHFHEVGSIASIIDVISAAVCLDYLQIQEVIIPVLYDGQGITRCEHGVLPIPVPAVASIVAEQGLKMHITKYHEELVTPTGAAIAAAIRTSEELPEQFSIKKTGIGAGKRDYESPGILRAMLIE